MNWYLEAWRKYAVFSGRARRKEYWVFFLIHILIVFLLASIDASAGITSDGETSVLAGLYLLASFLPSVAVTVRRLHDTGRSGWWVLISLIPPGGLVLLLLMLQDSQPGDNKYGPNPKTGTDPVE